MNGPEHYRQAEELLGTFSRIDRSLRIDVLGMAICYALLAATAAQVMEVLEVCDSTDDAWQSWREVIETPMPNGENS